MVNYERVNWDKSNALQIRLVNEALANIQRKASFIDTFLRSPRVITYQIWGDDPRFIYVTWWVLHPNYPVLAATYLEEGYDYTIPVNEIDPDDGIQVGDSDGKSRIYETFDWKNAQIVEIQIRQEDIDNIDSSAGIRRWLEHQYRGVRGESQLLPLGTQVGSYTAYQDDMYGIILIKDNGLNRPEINYTVDDLWTYFKYLLGRSIESFPTEVFYNPPLESDDAHNQFSSSGEDDQTLSEAVWPELRGIYTGYIDNLAIFCPVGFEVDTIVTTQLYYQLRTDGYDPSTFDKMVVLIDQRTTAGLQNTGFKDIANDIGNIPFPSDLISQVQSFGTWMYTKTNHQRRFWPRIYAFGRQPSPIPSPSACKTASSFYYNTYQKTYKGPIIWGVDEIECKRLVGMLIQKGYLKPAMAGGWY